jgi:hypothetical protein
VIYKVHSRRGVYGWNPYQASPAIYRNQLAGKSSENNNNNKTRTMKIENKKESVY